MGETADQLREEVDQKREDAAQKTDQIQAMVEGTAQQVKETVQETTQQVKGVFDLRKQIEERPLLALGAALAGGFVLGGILGGGDRDDRRTVRYAESPRSAGGYSSSSQASSGGVVETVRKAAKSSGLDDTVNAMVGAFVGSLADRVKAIGGQSFPGIAQKPEGGQRASQAGGARGAPTGAAGGRPTAGPTP